MGNFIKQLSIKNKDNEEYEVLSINNKKGFVRQKDQFGEHEVASSDKHNYKIIHNGNYAYNPARINMGSIARLEEFENGIISPMYIMFDIKNKELSSDYLKFYLKSETFKYNMLKRLEGSVRQTLSFDALKNIHISVPNYETQEKTSNFLKVYASNIQLVAEYIDALQGRSKNTVHETYIKTNPEKLKEIYVKNMKNVMIYNKEPKKQEIKEDIHNNQCLLIRPTG